MAAGKSAQQQSNIRKRRGGKSNTNIENNNTPSNNNNNTRNSNTKNGIKSSKKQKGSKKRHDENNKDKNTITKLLMMTITIAIIAVSFFSFTDTTSKRRNEYKVDYDKNDPIQRQAYNFLSSFLCHNNNKNNNNGGYCHSSLVSIPQRRTQMVSPTNTPKKINAGETILVVPRYYQIWDLDAMRNVEFVQKELFGARHETTLRAIDSGGYLAAYLVRRFRLALGTWDDDSNDDDATTENVKIKDEMLPFLEILPTYQNLSTTNNHHHHPILWNETTKIKLLGKRTVSYNLVKAYKDMIYSEYNAFASKSKIFASRVTREEYMSMRINVMSRSFGPGPPGPEEEESNKQQTIQTELEHYKIQTGVDLSKGCRAMSPVLDMYDHHAKPNVEWRYQSNQRAFVVKAKRGGIEPNQDVMVSYGTYTDSHLFAKFGFVNGDGSGYTEVDLAVFHYLYDVGLGQQFSYVPLKGGGGGGGGDVDGDAMDRKRKKNRKREMVRYLQYDDGYDKCIRVPSSLSSPTDANDKKDQPTDDELAWTLKRLKLKHLVRIANDRSMWTLTMPPRNETSKPAATSAIPIVTVPPKFDASGGKKLKFDASKIIATCRLIVLTHYDFDGEAIEMLSKALEDENGDVDNSDDENSRAPFLFGRDTDELEHRALSCLARLIEVELKRYPTSVKEDMELLTGDSSPPFRSREWTAAHVRLGEMQSLEALRSISLSGAIQMREKIEKLDKRGGGNHGRNPLLVVRRKPCPFELSAPLVEE